MCYDLERRLPGHRKQHENGALSCTPGTKKSQPDPDFSLVVRGPVPQVRYPSRTARVLLHRFLGAVPTISRWEASVIIRAVSRQDFTAIN